MNAAKMGSVVDRGHWVTPCRPGRHPRMKLLICPIPDQSEQQEKFVYWPEIYDMPTIADKLLIPKHSNSIVIQGLPSALEKDFSSFSFIKHLSPPLSGKQLDFVLVFAVNQKQLSKIFQDFRNSIGPQTIFWIAYPRPTSKIATDLTREATWGWLWDRGFRHLRTANLDHVWDARQLALTNKHRSSTSNSDQPTELYFEISIPDSVSEAQAQEIVTHLAFLANEEHRRLGGKGLTVRDISVDELLKVPFESFV